jgi:outer membrane protein OmpA-like peptidoglycan-associated protein
VRQKTSKRLNKVPTCALAAILSLAVFVSEAASQDGFLGQLFDNKNGATNERYVPTIWVDPDGCEHWVMDDGFEGYMTPHVSRDGIPVCRQQDMCGVMNADQFFRSDSARIASGGKARLTEFFRKADATSFIIVGHTDSSASDGYNMRLSQRRAAAVAKVATEAGGKIAAARGMGERAPVASNGTAAGMAKNRRVEVICVR